MTGREVGSERVDEPNSPVGSAGVIKWLYCLQVWVVFEEMTILLTVAMNVP